MGGRRLLGQSSFQTQKVLAAQEMPRSNKPFPKPQQGSAPVRSALDSLWLRQHVPQALHRHLETQYVVTPSEE